MNSDVSFGVWLQRRRKALDLTREELAQLAGCSVSALRKIEGDERRPSKQLAGLLANWLDITPEERPSFIKMARGELSPEQYRRSAISLPVDRQPERPAKPFCAHLPFPDTPLVGRQAELAALAQLLADPTCRLITLVGPGGIGKTRLAMQAALNHCSALMDGAVFVSLDAIETPASIVPAIADELGFSFSGVKEPKVQVLHYLQDKQMLFVLDNVEHLLAGIDLFAEVIHFAPQVKLLVTSREQLNLHGEWVFEIGGLAIPPSGQAPGFEDYSAVALFLQSLSRVCGGYTLREEDREAVARICRLVDGMPLALELAASWGRLLSCEEIASEIERNLDFLATSMRDIPERHRSLRAVFDHSWNLLSADECQVLGRLSVFRGGFSREAAQDVAGASLPQLSALAAKSLLRRVKEGRYDMHELVRQYAAARLQSESEITPSAHELPAWFETRWQHALYFLKLVETAKIEIVGPQQVSWLNTLEQEQDNLRAVLDWAMESQTATGVTYPSQPVEIGLLLAGALWYFWYVRSYHSEGGQRLAKLLERPEAAGLNTARARALYAAGALKWTQGDYTGALPLLDEALDINIELKDRRKIAPLLLTLGLVTSGLGDFDTARAYLEQSLAIQRERESKADIGPILFHLGDVAVQQGEYEEAERLFDESITLLRALDDKNQLAYALRRLGHVLLHKGDDRQAIVLFQESLCLNIEVGHRQGIAACLAGFAASAIRRGRIEVGVRLGGAMAAILEEIATTLLPLDQQVYELNISLARAQLDGAAFAAAWEAGRTMTLSEAIVFTQAEVFLL